MEQKHFGSGKFALGSVYLTPGAQRNLGHYDIMKALSRHVEADWGEVCRKDREENDLSLREGFRLLSAYRARNGTKFWVITEADRSATNILLPDEY